MRHLLFAVSVLACAAAPAERAKAWAAPAAHRPLTVMGRDFWPVLYRYGDWGLWYKASRVRFDNPAILDAPAFAEAAPAYHSHARPPAAETGLAAWRDLADNFAPGEPEREILDENPHPERPLFLDHAAKRGILSFGGRVDLDHAAYQAWRNAHTNLMFDGMLSEWDNDLMAAYSRVGKVSDETRRREIEGLLGEMPKDRYARVAKMRQYYDWRRKISYGGTMCVGFAHVLSGHLGADCGASLLSVEQTNTTAGDAEYRWNFAPMFARGAARQFAIPWLWYQADYMIGYAKDGGRQVRDSDCVYPVNGEDRGGDHWGPAFGQSSSLVRRGLFYAYLNGANFTEVEQWSCQFLTWDARTGRTELSPRAKDYAAFHDFTRRHPNRGTPWTPVAICLPLAQGYTAYGGYPWDTWDLSYGYTDGDYTVDSLFFALVPGFARDAAMRRGVETNLHNTPHAMMYDVICPDAPSRTPEQLLETFRGYRILVIAGDYPDRSFEAAVGDYRREGGKVIRVKTQKRPENAHRAIADLRSGRTRFPETEKMFSRLEAALFPFKVEGDCLYGANRTEAGWWLWVFNNKGVTKFADAPERIDPTAAVHVRVSGKRLAGQAVRELVTEREVPAGRDGFAWTLGAGEVAVFEITPRRGVLDILKRLF